MAHTITIGDNPKATAQIQASLIQSDVETGAAQPPGDHVVYHDPGPNAPDTWKSPAEVNATGKASCNSIVRAAAPFVPGGVSHVGVAESTDPKTGDKVQHAFLVAAPKPGDPAISVDADGKAVGGIPASRIVDPSVARGMAAPPTSLYQAAALAPVKLPASAATAPAPTRAAAGEGYQGTTRLHTPATSAGAAVAEASQVAGRAVVPPPEHVPRPAEELYPGHPILTGIGTAEQWLSSTPEWRTSAGMLRNWYDGLGKIVLGEAPVALPGDPAVSAEMRESAKQIRGFVELLKRVEDKIPGAAEQLEAVKVALRRGPAEGKAVATDAIRSVVAEVDAMAPGVVPAHVREALVQAPPLVEAASPAEVDAAPATVAATALWLMLPNSEGPNRESTSFPLDLALTMTVGQLLGERWAVGYPDDDYRRTLPRPEPDPRLGAPAPATASAGGMPGMGSGGGPTASATPASTSIARPLGGGGEAPAAPSASLTSTASAGASMPRGRGGFPGTAGLPGGGRWWERGGEDEEIIAGGDDEEVVSEAPGVVDVGGDLVFTGGEDQGADLLGGDLLYQEPVVSEEVVEEPAVTETVEAMPAEEVVDEEVITEGAPRVSWWRKLFGLGPAPRPARVFERGVAAPVADRCVVNNRDGTVTTLFPDDSYRLTRGGVLIRRGTDPGGFARCRRYNGRSVGGAGAGAWWEVEPARYGRLPVRPGTRPGTQIPAAQPGVRPLRRPGAAPPVNRNAPGYSASALRAERAQRDAAAGGDVNRAYTAIQKYGKPGVRLAGWGGFWQAHGWDRHTASRELTAAIRAYRRDPLVRAQLASGGTVYGFNLGELRAAMQGLDNGSGDPPLSGWNGDEPAGPWEDGPLAGPGWWVDGPAAPAPQASILLATHQTKDPALRGVHFGGYASECNVCRAR